MTNKNNKFKISFLILVGLIFATPVFASTSVVLSPSNVSVKEGQTFNVAVSVDPASVKNYTIKLEIKYPADILEIDSFNIAKGWTPWQQPGYYLIDNANGTMIQSAGYPGGLTTATSFGTVVFKAKKAGNANISVTTNSMALDSTNQNLIAGLPVTIGVTVGQIVPTVVESKVTTQTVTQQTTQTKPVVKTEVSVEPKTTEPTLSAEIATQTSEVTDSITPSQTANVIFGVNFSSWKVLVSLAIIILIGLIVFFTRRKKENQVL